MKTICLLFSLIALVQGCKENSVTNKNSNNPYPINVHFQTGFDRDSALIMINGALVASIDSITTDPVIVLAASRRFTIVPGTHTLSVIIPTDNVRADTTFIHIEKELWVGVNYNRYGKKINYIFQYSPFAYK